MGIVIVVVFLLIGGLVTFIALNNLTPLVHLQVLSWHTSDLPLGLWLVAAFLSGAILLLLVAFLSALGDWHRMKLLRKQVITLQEKVRTLSQTSSSSSEPTTSDRLSSENTAPLPHISSTTNTPAPDGRRSTSPLSSQSNFHP